MKVKLSLALIELFDDLFYQKLLWSRAQPYIAAEKVNSSPTMKIAQCYKNLVCVFANLRVTIQPPNF